MKHIKLFEAYTNDMLKQREDMMLLRNYLHNYFAKNSPLDVNVEILGEYPEEYIGDYIELKCENIKIIITSTKEDKLLVQTWHNDTKGQNEIYSKNDFDGILDSVINILDLEHETH